MSGLWKANGNALSMAETSLKNIPRDERAYLKELHEYGLKGISVKGFLPHQCHDKCVDFFAVCRE